MLEFIEFWRFLLKLQPKADAAGSHCRLNTLEIPHLRKTISLDFYREFSLSNAAGQAETQISLVILKLAGKVEKVGEMCPGCLTPARSSFPRWELVGSGNLFGWVRYGSSGTDGRDWRKWKCDARRSLCASCVIFHSFVVSTLHFL